MSVSPWRSLFHRVGGSQCLNNARDDLIFFPPGKIGFGQPSTLKLILLQFPLKNCQMSETFLQSIIKLMMRKREFSMIGLEKIMWWINLTNDLSSEGGPAVSHLNPGSHTSRIKMGHKKIDQRINESSAKKKWCPEFQLFVATFYLISSYSFWNKNSNVCILHHIVQKTYVMLL